MTAITSSKGYETPLIYTGTPPAEAEIACAGANAYTSAAGKLGDPQAGVIDLGVSRRLSIFGHVDAGAAGSIVSLVIGLSAARVAPVASTSGRWFPVSKLDDLSVNAVLAAVPGMGGGVGATVAPAWSQNTLRPIDIRTAAGVNATDEIPFRVVIDVSDVRWAWVRYGQADAGAAAKILAYFSLSSG